MIFPNTIIALTALLFNANQAHAYGDRTGLCTDDVQAMAESVMGGKNDLKIGWQLTSSSKSYNAGETIQISFKPKSKGDTFKGLLLYANDENNNHVGTFVSLSGDFQTMDDMCKEYGSAGSTLSHKNAKDKPSNLKFSWKAPADGAGLVQFRGFLVTKSQNTWLAFPPLNVSGPGSPADKSSASNNTDPTGAAAVNTASSPLTILLTSCLTLSFSITFFHRIFV